jgi:hypothetical protein
VPDDREHVQPGEPTLLVVEDDPHYAECSSISPTIAGSRC